MFITRPSAKIIETFRSYVLCPMCEMAVRRNDSMFTLKTGPSAKKIVYVCMIVINKFQSKAIMMTRSFYANLQQNADVNKTENIVTATKTCSK